MAAVEEYQHREAACQPILVTMNSKLLAVGGDRLSPQPYSLVPLIFEHGKINGYPVKLRKIVSNACAEDSEYLWRSGA
jgi:hypothetical protein